MRFYKNLYLGDTVKKPEKLIKKLKRHKKLPPFFVIAYDEEPAGLTIYPSIMLTQWYYKENPPACIIGLANSKEEAFTVIEQMVQDSLAQTGQASLLAYLSETDPKSFQG